MNLNNLKEKIKKLESNTSSVKGKLELVEEQYESNLQKIDELKELKKLNTKSVELLTLVQKATSDLIQEMIENVVTKALQYVHQDDGYEFELKFDKHGNNPKLSFLLKTPDMQEPHDIMNTRAGGSKDIIVLALRLVLLEIQKNKGFVFTDEPFKRLNDNKIIENAVKFLNETQKDTGRQMIMITHKQPVIDSIDNLIKIGE